MPVYKKPEAVTAEQQNAISLDSDEQPAVREITQTDRLNKNLLNAFLNRINNGDLNFQQDNEDEQNDEWVE